MSVVEKEEKHTMWIGLMYTIDKWQIPFFMEVVMDLRIECDDAPQWSGKGSLRHWTWRGILVGENQKL